MRVALAFLLAATVAGLPLDVAQQGPIIEVSNDIGQQDLVQLLPAVKTQGVKQVPAPELKRIEDKAPPKKSAAPAAVKAAQSAVKGESPSEEQSPVAATPPSPAIAAESAVAPLNLPSDKGLSSLETSECVKANEPPAKVSEPFQLVSEPAKVENLPTNTAVAESNQGASKTESKSDALKVQKEEPKVEAKQDLTSDNVKAVEPAKVESKSSQDQPKDDEQKDDQHKDDQQKDESKTEEPQPDESKNGGEKKNPPTDQTNGDSTQPTLSVKVAPEQETNQPLIVADHKQTAQIRQAEPEEPKPEEPKPEEPKKEDLKPVESKPEDKKNESKSDLAKKAESQQIRQADPKPDEPKPEEPKPEEPKPEEPKQEDKKDEPKTEVAKKVQNQQESQKVESAKVEASKAVESTQAVKDITKSDGSMKELIRKLESEENIVPAPSSESKVEPKVESAPAPKPEAVEFKLSEEEKRTLELETAPDHHKIYTPQYIPLDISPKMKLKSKDSKDRETELETSEINGRIFDDQQEKSDFERRKKEMNNLVAASITKEDRVKQCVGKCGEGLKLFTVWTTRPEGWNNKYTHSIDSALYHHPKAKVSIYSSSLPSDFLDEWKKLGYDVSVERLHMKDRASGTPLEYWSANLEKWHDGPFYYAHLSDAARLLVLYKEGGVYFDTDVVFVNSMDSVKNVVGWERSDSLCNALMAFNSRNPYLEEVLRQFNDHYVMDDWAGNGPVLLTKVYKGKFKNSDQIHALEKAAFYLISWDDVHRYFDKQSARDIDRDLQILRQKAYVVHFWNSRSHDLVVHPESLMARMFTSYCVHCNPIHHKVIGTEKN